MIWPNATPGALWLQRDSVVTTGYPASVCAGARQAARPSDLVARRVSMLPVRLPCPNRLDNGHSAKHAARPRMKEAPERAVLRLN